ncbi:MAG: hypothetical protein R3F02_02815 [Thiolinea sp.]
MSLYRKRRHNPLDPFIDLLFNTLLGFSFLFLVSLVFINPKADQAKVDMQAEYMITATWPSDIADDIDLWVYSPYDDTVSYLRREAGFLMLDRDDRGVKKDKIIVDGQEVFFPLNQEIVTIRKRYEGEYVVNLYYYQNASPPPIEVEIKIDRINPRFETVYRDTVTLKAQDEEVTAVRFTINQDGSVGQFNKLPLKLTPYGLEHIPTDIWNR